MFSMLATHPKVLLPLTHVPKLYSVGAVDPVAANAENGATRMRAQRKIRDIVLVFLREIIFILEDIMVPYERER